MFGREDPFPVNHRDAFAKYTANFLQEQGQRVQGQ
jgi:hypothetical protein